MNWVNVYGLMIISLIMIPNIIFAVKRKNEFKNSWKNKFVEVPEQIGRFGCFIFMIIAPPKLCGGFASASHLTAYLATNLSLVLIYCIIWYTYFNKNCIFRALALSALPSVIFIFSAIMTRHIPLLVFSLIFAPCHILLSVKNCILSNSHREENKHESRE